MKKIYMLCFVLFTSICGAAQAGELYTFQATDREGLLSDGQKSALNGLRSKRVFESVSLVQLSAAALESTEITLTTRNGSKFTFVGQNNKRSLDLNYTWQGVSASGGTVKLDLFQGVVSGSARVDGRKLAIRALGNEVTLLLEYKPNLKFGNDTPDKVGDFDNLKDLADQVRQKLKDDAVKLDQSRPSSQAPSVVGWPTIRVLMVWSSDAVARQSNYAQVSQQLIASINQDFMDSGVSLNVVQATSLVVSSSTGYRASAASALSVLRNDQAVLALRDLYDADIVALVNDMVGTDPSEYIAIGKAMQIGATPQTAFMMVDENYVLEGDTVFQHEFGHLLGGRHQMSGDPRTDDTNNTPRAYGHGIIVADNLNGAYACIGDIMASITTSPTCPYNNPDGLSQAVELSQYSNPSLGYNHQNGNYVRNLRIGDSSTANMTRLLNELGGAVTTFHNTKLAASAPVPPAPTLDYAGPAITIIFNIIYSE